MLSYAAACKADCVKQNPFGFTQSLLRLFHFTQGEAFHARLLPPARNSGFGFDLRARNERADNQKQNTVTFPCEAEASSSSKRNKWGQSVGGTVYAGSELELAGAERYPAAFHISCI